MEAALNGAPGRVGVLVARYLSPSVREKLDAAGRSYLDLTGNVLIHSDKPALLVSGRGEDSDPWRGPGRPLGALKGEPAAKVVRALVDFEGPWKIRDLVAVSQASTGSVYRVIDFLDAEGLLERGAPRGLISVPDWAAILRRWSLDYSFLKTNAVTRWIAPRGVPDFLSRVRQGAEDDYAFTGSLAASVWSEYAPVRSATLYATHPERAADAWGLRPTDTGANILIAHPRIPAVMERTITALDGLRLVAPTQAAVDLMRGPGRAPAESEELMEWMGRNVQRWR
ncbi:hypothetical protein [Psychromicrobium xiongbiense]|uniref:hypothetical protein n=1 Tax=Psychromicrobium xiongbiense TaxID=3051184 RepID=UPI00255690FD|nr:hypothetical protein [Psychromicrobium sp. YIM S02556]